MKTKKVIGPSSGVEFVLRKLPPDRLIQMGRRAVSQGGGRQAIEERTWWLVSKAVIIRPEIWQGPRDETPPGSVCAEDVAGDFCHIADEIMGLILGRRIFN